jgi:cell division protein ZapA (FtsZ GTPase activity inhibitor)
VVRSAHIRVERVAFIAALNTRLAVFKKFEEKLDAAMSKHKENVKAIEDKHNAALTAWANKIKEESIF